MYCARFDGGHAARAMAMWESLQAVAPDSHLHVCCFDDASLRVTRELRPANTTVWSVRDLETWDGEFAAVRAKRSRVEYLWTAIPLLPMFVLAQMDCAEVTYVDSDLLFFADPEPLFEEMGDSPLLLTPARYPRAHRSLSSYGSFPTQFIPLRDDPDAKAAFQWWRARCIESCSARRDKRERRYADQGYLDRWPELFDGVHILEHPGGGLAPWNMEGHSVDRDIRTGDVLVDGTPLIFFHYTHFRRYRDGVQFADPRFRIAPQARELIFEPYERILESWSNRVAEIDSDLDGFDSRPDLIGRLNQSYARVAGILGRGRGRLGSVLSSEGG